MNKRVKHMSSLSTVMLCAFLTACGGSGGGGKAPNTTGPEDSGLFLSPKFQLFNANPNGIDLTRSNTPRHLWVTDGTSDGTKALSTTLTMINSNQLGGYLDNGKKTIFAAYDTSAASPNIQPYISDGTASGTIKLKELTANGNGIDDSVKFTAHKNKVYFNGVVPRGPGLQLPHKLYVTDGTEGGTKAFASSDTNTYTDTSTNVVYKIPQYPSILSDKKHLYTTLKSQLQANQIVKILPEQTGSAVFEPVTGGQGVELQGMLVIKDHAYAMLGYTNGTRPERQLAKITTNGIQRTFSSLALSSVPASPSFVMSGSIHIDDDQYAVFVHEGANLKAIYFKKDGSTQVIALKQPNNTAFSNHQVRASYINDKGLYANISENSNPNGSINVLFPINNGVLSDKATLLNTGSLLSPIYTFAHVGNTLTFQGADVGRTATTCPGTKEGSQLWSITGERTLDRIKVVNAKANTSSLCPSASIAYLGHVNDNSLLLFQAYSGTNNDKGQELWVTDGTAANTKMLKDIAPGSTNTTKNGVAID